MNKSKSIKKVVVGIVLITGLIAVPYALFALTLMSSDHAYYSVSGKNLGEIDYEDVIFDAKKAGYTVDGSYYVNLKADHGLHPQNIKELDERFGDDYRIEWVYFYYTEDSGFEATLPTKHDGETKIHFFNESIHTSPLTNTTLIPVEPGEIPIEPGEEVEAKFKLTNLPSDEWVIEKFKLMFGFDEQKARHYLTQLKDSINRDQEPEILIKEAPDLLAVYNNFKEISSNSTFSLPVGEGSCKETFYKGDEKIGTIPYTVPNVRITHRDKGHEYTIKIDRLGGVNLRIKLDVRDKIPEEEYRSVFKDMFVDIGLPPERVDEFEFKYRPSIW